MSGGSDISPCPVCKKNMTAYSDYKPFETVSLVCPYCGFYGYTKTGMYSDEERSLVWADHIDSKFKKLSKAKKLKYLKAYDNLVGDLTDQERIDYLGRSNKIKHKKHKVRIEVLGGVAYAIAVPNGIEVDIVDYDNK